IKVVEKLVLAKPFCQLLRFAPQPEPADMSVWRTQKRPARPVVLVCAPLAGHHAVLLREMVETLLLNHEVYITDWRDARNVPVADGPFHLDDYVSYIQAFIRHIGAEKLHVISVCQATVPTLAAISLLASELEPTPRSLILMGGPLDARNGANAVNLFAASQPLRWFRETLIHSVPDHYPGAGREVYPGFLQHAGLVVMHPGRIASSHWDYCLDTVRGDLKGAEAHQRSCAEYSAVLDMAAEYYLDTVQTVFQEFRLARGRWYVRGLPVRPQDIRTTALLTIEGALDDVSGRGQTHAAQDLCAGIAASDKRGFTMPRCGHYDLFSGPCWQTDIYPIVRDLIDQYDASHGPTINTSSTSRRATLRGTPESVPRSKVRRARHAQNT
ncbi:polyhydroxyalkanoate depolymerase, partial [Caballeronia sp.]|uniref:polyhydroxyalkanoate depolymerase n=1 Tax=Caballeronia sp. TaxID=1931223 RepID=UPI003C39F072